MVNFLYYKGEINGGYSNILKGRSVEFIFKTSSSSEQMLVSDALDYTDDTTYNEIGQSIVIKSGCLEFFTLTNSGGVYNRIKTVNTFDDGKEHYVTFAGKTILLITLIHFLNTSVKKVSNKKISNN